jgi:hypothetical protein
MTALSREEEAAEADSRRIHAAAAASVQLVPASSNSRLAAPASVTPTVPAAVASAAFALPPCPTILLDLAIVDEVNALDQCGGEWIFFHELLCDFLLESDRALLFREFDRAIAENDHRAFQNQADGLNGSAHNLHLTALMDAGRKTMTIACGLQNHPELAGSPQWSEYLEARRPFVDHLRVEFDRLTSVHPRYAALAAAEAAYEAEQEERQAAEHQAAYEAARIAAEIEARAGPPSSNQLSPQSRANGAT